MVHLRLVVVRSSRRTCQAPARASPTPTMENAHPGCKSGSSEGGTMRWRRPAPLSWTIAQLAPCVNRGCTRGAIRLGSDGDHPFWSAPGTPALRRGQPTQPAARRALRLCAGRAYPREQVESRRHRWMPPRGPWRHLYHMEYSRCQLGTGRWGRSLVLWISGRVRCRRFRLLAELRLV